MMRIINNSLITISSDDKLNNASRFFDLSFDMLCIAGEDGYFKQLNPAWAETLGYTLEELYAKPFVEFVHPDDRAATLAEAGKLAQGEQTISFENRYLCQNGDYKWLHWTSSFVTEEGLIYSVARDITRRKEMELELQQLNEELTHRVEARTRDLEQEIIERQQAEEALKESQDRFRAIADYTYDWETWVDPAGETQWINPTVERITGYSVAECFAMSDYPLPLVHEEDRAEVAEILHAALHDQTEGNDFEFRVRHKQGQVIWVAISWQAAYNSQGDYLGYRTSVRDFTERKQINEAQERLQQEVIEAQKQAIQELSVPIIPLMEGIIVMPLIGSIDSMRAQDLMRTLLAGISQHRASVVILDITGVPIVDTGVAAHLDKTIQAARLKGARTIVTGISDAVAETVVDLGIDWSRLETLRDLQSGLLTALDSLGFHISH